MWLKNDGFFMAEMLLSLSAWLIATSIFLPLALFLIGQSVQLRQEADAALILYDRLQQAKLYSGRQIEGSIEKAGTVYRFTTSQHDSVMEVCVEFDGYLKKETSKCALAE